MTQLAPRERRSAALAIALALTLATGGTVAGQSAYPEKPIKIVHINAAGGPADILARLIGDKLTAAWRQPVLVEPMVGAAGNIAVGHVAKAAPDGYTLVMSGDAAVTTNVSLYKYLSYDPLKHLAPITQVVATPNILAVHPDVPAKTVQELVALAKSPSANLTYAHGGVGFSTHLSGQVFNIMAGTSIQHIPIRTPSALTTDLITNRVNMCFCNISQMLPLIRDGKLRGLAVTSLQRAPQAPDLPTLHEFRLSGVRRDLLVRAPGAGRHACSRHRQAAQRNRSDRRAARVASTAHPNGYAGGREYSRRTDSGDPETNSGSEETDRGGQNRAAIAEHGKPKGG